ncbi:MAG: hypothetical protein ACM3YM_08695 [Sphingomonadales bacterium]
MMHVHRVARLRLLLATALAAGCSAATLTGTFAAISAGVPTTAAPRPF